MGSSAPKIKINKTLDTINFETKCITRDREEHSKKELSRQVTLVRNAYSLVTKDEDEEGAGRGTTFENLILSN